jgi:hypothetical protein
MRSIIDAFAHQQLDSMEELRRDFGRRPHPRPQRPERIPQPVAQAGRVRSWLGHVGHGLAVRLHLAGHGHSM